MEPGPPTHAVLSQWLTRSPGPSREFGGHLIRAFQSVQRVADDPECDDGFMMPHKLAPVEFVFIGGFSLKDQTP